MFARIDILPSGAFWARASMIGLTDAEFDAMESHRPLPADRTDQINFVLKIAAQSLAQRQPEGTC